MPDIKTAKDTLVASLFELSKAAQDAASATVEFYKVVANEEADESIANNIKEVQSAAANLVNAAATVGPKSKKRKTKKDDEEEEEATSNGSVAEEETTPVEKKKRKKAIKDPNAPKKPLTMYFAYSFFHRDLIRKEREKKGLEPLPTSELNEIVKKQWETISDEDKKKWQDKYQKELADYKIKRDAYAATKDEASTASEAPKPEAGADSASDSASEAASEAAPEAASTVEKETVSVPVLSPVKKEKKKSKKSSDEDTDKKEKKKKKKTSSA